MRIILYSGKGGVGKTSVAAATGLELARRGKRTLVMSVDPAHSLSDSFDLEEKLISRRSDPLIKVTKNLWMQEVDIQEEISRHWGAVHSYVAPRNDAGCALWALRDLISTLVPSKGGRGSRSTSASIRHLRSAGVEALEALRAVLDETIEWLREERGSESKLRRIRVDG